jgi:quinol-cytochrome oxidoreductase complex cytochrome b subunit
MIILLRSDASDADVRDVTEAVRALGLGTAPLDDVRGSALEIVGPDPSRVLGLRGHRGIAEILTRRTPLAGGEPIWPHFALRLAILALLLLSAIALLSAFAPPGLDDRANPALAPGPPLVEWYLRPLEGLVRLAGPVSARVIVACFWILFFAWPFLDRADPATPRGRRTLLALRLLGIALLALLVALGFR